MTQADLERLYEAMAHQIDSVGADHAPLYLAKLALLLAHHLDDPETALRSIADAARSLDAGPAR
tara:strand:+ start:5772 stop:5963 length:192 start_codon:yes stop_codon:yes gene_type:complete